MKAIAGVISLAAAALCAIFMPATALAHGAHTHSADPPGWDGRIPGMPDFKKIGKTTYRFLPGREEYEVREPGNSVGYIHADPKPADVGYAASEEGGSFSIGPAVELPTQELAPYCRLSRNRIVVVYTHRESDPSPTPVGQIRSIVNRMNWKIADQSSQSSGGGRVVHMVVDCNTSGEVIVHDVPTNSGSYTTIEGEVRKALDTTVGADDGIDAVKYLIFEKEPWGEVYGIGGPVYTDLTKSRQNANSTTTNSATIYAPETWVKHVSIHELMHALGATQGKATPAAPYSVVDNHCSDGQDALCYGSFGDAYCPSSAGYGTPVNVPIDCNKNTYFNAAPPGGSWLASYWNVAGYEDPFLITEPDQVPSVTTGSASGVAKKEATLNGTITPRGEHTFYYFEFGKTTSYGSSTLKPSNPKYLEGPASDCGRGK